MSAPIISQAVIVITQTEGRVSMYASPVFPAGDNDSIAAQTADALVNTTAVIIGESPESGWVLQAPAADGAGGA